MPASGTLKAGKLAKKRPRAYNRKRQGKAVSLALSPQQMTSNNNAKPSTNARAKNGPVRSFKPAISASELSQVAASAASLPFEALAMPETVGKKKSSKNSSSKGERIRIEWPQEVVEAAEQLEILLAEFQPVKGHSPCGLLLATSRATEEVTQAPIREPEAVRQDQQAVWALWLAHGAGGAVPAMAQGEALSLFDLMRAVAGAPAKVRRMAAFRRLWAGTGEAGSILSQIAKHTGRTVRLDLKDWSVTLTDQQI